MEIYLFLLVSYLLYTVSGSNAFAKYDARCQYQNESLDCSNRQLKSTDCQFPRDVQNITMDKNIIEVIPSMCFNGLEYAKYIYFNSNKIRYIDQYAFWGLENLLTLQLYDNEIKNVPTGVFKPLISLQSLWIYDNRYSYNKLPFHKVMQELSPLKKLKSLYTDMNIQINSSDWCPISGSLEYLYVDIDNPITIATNIFNDMSNLKELNIYGVGGIEKSSFQRLFNLSSLTIKCKDNTNIEDVFASFGVFRGRNMNILSVTGNSHRNDFHINKNHFVFIQHICLKQLILKNLFITYIEPQSFSVFSHESRCLEVLDISHNSISTNKNDWLYSMSRFPKLKVFKASYFMNDNDVGNFPLYQVNDWYFDSVTVSLPMTLEELHIRYSITIYNLPRSFIFRNGDNLRSLDFGYLRFGKCNGTLLGLPNVQIFDMSGWNCSILSELLLLHFPKLHKFVARESFLGIGFKVNINSYKFFDGNSDLRYIDMSGNSIQRLPPGLLGSHLSHLQFLNLSNNKLLDFPIMSPKMSELKVIDLRSNNIPTISSNMRDILDIVFPEHLYLGDNPFKCTCDSTEFLMWLNKTNIQKSIDIKSMKCITETGSFTDMSPIVMDVTKFTKRCASKIWIVIAATLCSIVLTVLILTIVYIRYKYLIEYLYIRIKIKLRKYKQLEENEYEFQAFVSHSHLDTEWVLELYNNLTSRGVDICLDAKDFIVGNSVAENIVQAINRSRKVIFVITENFLESTWGSYELEMTRMHAFREDRENMIIVVMKDEIKLHKLPKVLRDIWYKILCIKWNNQPTNEFETEDVFYNRLYEAVSL